MADLGRNPHRTVHCAASARPPGSECQLRFGR
jgi:hypothetical protein